MAVETVYRSSYDLSTQFMKRSEADKHDLMLETAEHLSSLIRHVLPTVTEDDAEKLGIYMAQNREALATALKKNPSGISGLIKPVGTTAGSVVSLPAAS
ncbi:hypothetical protein GIW05_03115 [Pseudomonas syringae]|uniref:YebG family protein n=1 Tax=Pseudomonas syringae TaxID=317 RepID=UPI001F2BDF3D|nr:YebG family protein [Pseudomonas syringae]MCF5382495.1 hypothetical protein [Pseudomonas syringae]MCF5419382.1 hypothetical protein [Pseudomonas syringae]MCF5451929.1 hypothetical protein [Pseudomonas syringae]MCF5460266.1 hypothetical protein [Pseudomonas syringae]